MVVPTRDADGSGELRRGRSPLAPLRSSQPIRTTRTKPALIPLGGVHDRQRLARNLHDGVQKRRTRSARRSTSDWGRSHWRSRSFCNTGRHERLRERRQPRKAAKPDKGPPRWQRELSKGSPRTTFVIGALLTLPGASYLAGLDQIHKLKYSTTVTVLLVIGFNLVMLWLLEVPLASFLVAPEWTPRAIDRAKLWVSRHAHMFAVRGFGAVGVLLVIKGIVGLVS
jgi:Sap, sulfolipid-1-addressing protein